MINPYSCYILGFIFSLFVYQFGWSEIYPPISTSLIGFLIATIVSHFVFSKWWVKNKFIKNKNDEVSSSPKLNPWFMTIFLYICWSADFINEGGVPLFKMLFNLSYDYRAFGVPSLHVFTVTFTSFYCIYLLHLFLKTTKKEYLLLYLINMVSAILIYSRSMLFFNLASSFFLYLLYIDKIPYKKLLLVAPIIIILFYLFGVVGTARVSFESKTNYDQNSFLDNGKATFQFRNSVIPKEFFWPYIYISSPIANLQVNINTYATKPITLTRVLEYINNEWLFESISKRINKLFGVEREKENNIKDPFNVSTVYCRSYSYLGWAGIIAMGLFVLIVPMAYRKLIVNNPYQLISVAILCTTYLFMTYDNMIRLMALGFQLVYPLVFPAVENKISQLRIRR
jgi:oligosaccharide repeat unit polymerase